MKTKFSKSTKIRGAIIGVCIAAATVVGLASAAAADTPDRGTFVRHVTGFRWLDCSTLVPGTGVIFADGTSTVDFVDFFRDGVWVRETVHQHFEGVLHGPHGDAPYEIVANRSFDPSPIAVVTGHTVYYLPGRTEPLVEAGRAVIDLDEHMPISLTPHMESKQAVCAAIG
jgi:hypothetical protein